MATRLSNKPLLAIQTVESAITWHPDFRISHYLASRLSNQPLLGIQTVESAITWHPDMSNQQSVPHVNVYERSTGSRHSSCTSLSVSTPAMNLKVS